jgi:hypothetical protein
MGDHTHPPCAMRHPPSAIEKSPPLSDPSCHKDLYIRSGKARDTSPSASSDSTVPANPRTMIRLALLLRDHPSRCSRYAQVSQATTIWQPRTCIPCEGQVLSPRELPTHGNPRNLGVEEDIRPHPRHPRPIKQSRGGAHLTVISTHNLTGGLGLLLTCSTLKCMKSLHPYRPYTITTLECNTRTHPRRSLRGPYPDRKSVV